jgi:Skp family chaperone for outer membrane proteins
MKTARRILVVAACSLAIMNAQALPVAYVDLADAYAQSTALKGLIQQVDARMQSIRTAFELKRDPILADIEALKTTKMHVDAQRERKRELLLQLAELEDLAAREQQAVGKANERATEQVDSEVVKLENELKLEFGLLAIFRTQDLLYQRDGNELNLSSELYQRLNQRLPTVELPIPPTREPQL